MKGIAKIKGPKNPIVGKDAVYEVVEFHKGTVVVNPNTIKWKIFKKKDNHWVEAKGNEKTGKKVTFNFSQHSYGKDVLVEAYLFEPEIKSPPGMIVKPVMGERKLLKVEIKNADGGALTKKPKYGESIMVQATTENMLGENLKMSIWERDTLTDEGHDPKGNTKLWDGNVKIKNDGIAKEKVVLTPGMAMLANKSLMEGGEHEYYLLVEAEKKAKISNTVAVQNTEIVLSPNVPKKSVPAPTPKPQEPSMLEQIELKIKDLIGWDSKPPGGNNKAVVEDGKTPKVEGIITAYFAKEEFTKEGSETAGQYKYKFQSSNTNIDKDKVAGIIKKRVDIDVKVDKKYSKHEDIKNALTITTYKKGDFISFNLYKLEANFVKITNAPLEEVLYVVVNTYLLDGKEVTIEIKEKEVILVGADANLPVLEGKENGSEITILKTKVEKGIAKVKIKIRPKTDETLATWKEKLTGIKDGTYKYKFVNNNTTTTSEQKKIAANAIANKIKDTLAGKKKFTKVDAIEKSLTKSVYNKDEEITFDVYKSVIGNLWLNAECQGDTKKHKGEFLKRDGEYFVIGQKCECEARIKAFMRMLRIGEGTEGDGGYTTQYSGTQFSDMSKHPENVITAGNYSSSAAGAYQIMRYTWWWLGGEKLTENNTKAGVYEENHDYIKKYSIPDFTQESQDKLCVIILKHKRPGSIELITSNKTKEALEKYGSYEWASLPPGRYGQPAQTMENALSKYEKFLKEELEGKTNLYLKNGFAKEFNIVCNCKKASAKTGYDIDAAVTYIESHAEASSTSACAKYVRQAVEAGGLTSNASPRNALNYFTILKDLGFTELQTTSYIKGDIVVFDGVEGHQYGHIAMWTGTQWISDFKQNSIIVNTAYNNGQSSIFRWQ
ncbi:MAG: hypothetical protein ABI549_02510 [Flavobacterium sp.]|uniref:hypothetical protein n=1 Tax=Flavobacterium sp. TaxID=239 RepID=UPI003266D188